MFILCHEQYINLGSLLPAEDLVNDFSQLTLILNLILFLFLNKFQCGDFFKKFHVLHILPLDTDLAVSLDTHYTIHLETSTSFTSLIHTLPIVKT